MRRKQTLPFIERHTARAVNIAMTAPFGPVHLNIPFREPLLIDFQETIPQATFKESFMSELAPSTDAIEAATADYSEQRTGIIIVGELALGTDTTHIWEFITKCQMAGYG